jgi:hypothetical protein
MDGAKAPADFLISNKVSLVIFWAVSDAAQEFSKVAFSTAQTWGHQGYVVEPRYATNIIEDLVDNEGFVVREGDPRDE